MILGQSRIVDDHQPAGRRICRTAFHADLFHVQPAARNREWGSRVLSQFRILSIRQAVQRALFVALDKWPAPECCHRERFRSFRRYPGEARSDHNRISQIPGVAYSGLKQRGSAELRAELLLDGIPTINRRYSLARIRTIGKRPIYPSLCQDRRGRQ